MGRVDGFFDRRIAIIELNVFADGVGVVQHDGGDAGNVLTGDVSGFQIRADTDLGVDGLGAAVADVSKAIAVIPRTNAVIALVRRMILRLILTYSPWRNSYTSARAPLANEPDP